MRQPHPVTVEARVVTRAIELLWQRRDADDWFHELLSHRDRAISGFAAGRCGDHGDLAAEPFLWAMIQNGSAAREKAFFALSELANVQEAQARIVAELLTYAVPGGPDCVSAAVARTPFTEAPAVEAAVRAVAASSNAEDRDCILYGLGDIPQPRLGPPER